MGDTSFSVEVLGFPDAQADVAASKVAKFFGIDDEEARRLVEKAPIKVKRGAAPAATEALVKQLLELGADVQVINEQSNDSKTYRAAERASPAPAEPARARPVSIEPPPASALDRGRVSGADALAQALADRKTRDGVPISAKQSRPGARMQAPTPLPSEGSSDAATSSAPPSPKEKKPLGTCASCSRAMEAEDEICGRCGWDQLEKRRVCPQCKGDLAVRSAVNSRKSLSAAILAAAVVAAVPVAIFVGALPGAALVAIAFAGILIADGVTLRFGCKTCKFYVASKLDPDEQKRIGAARVRSVAAGGALVAASAVMFSMTSWAPPELHQSSFGVGWSLAVPRSHAVIGQQLRPLKLGDTTAHLHVQRADRSFLPADTYWLMQVANAVGDAPTRADVEADAKAVARDMFSGTVTSTTDASGPDAKLGVEVKFKGTDRGKNIEGVMRALVYQNDVVFVAVTAPSAPDARGAFAALEVVNGTR